MAHTKPVREGMEGWEDIWSILADCREACGKAWQDAHTPQEQMRLGELLEWIIAAQERATMRRSQRFPGGQDYEAFREFRKRQPELVELQRSVAGWAEEVSANSHRPAAGKALANAEEVLRELERVGAKGE